jgi:hypothetical protein
MFSPTDLVPKLQIRIKLTDAVDACIAAASHEFETDLVPGHETVVKPTSPSKEALDAAPWTVAQEHRIIATDRSIGDVFDVVESKFWSFYVFFSVQACAIVCAIVCRM